MEALRISELADLTGLPVSTLRYYERIGLVPPPARLPNRYRVYDESVAELLAFIGRAKRMGVPLDQISELIELWSTGGCQPLQNRISAFLTEKISEVRTQRLEMTRFEAQLNGLLERLDNSDHSIGQCDLDCACVHLDPGDVSHEECSRSQLLKREAPCSLEHDLRLERVEEWQRLTSRGQKQRTPSGAWVRFSPSADVITDLASLCAQELSCCSFFSFNIDISTEAVILRVEVPDQAEPQAICDAIFGSATDKTMA